MDTKTKVIVAVVAMVAAFGAGYYVTPTKTVVKTETKTVVKEVEVQHTDTHKDTVTTETETRKPDGTVVITRVTTNRDQTVTDDHRTNNETMASNTTKTVERSSPAWSIAGMAGIDVTNRGNPIKYGLHVQNQIIGPVAVGAFGMTDGSVGLSVGLRF